MLPPILRKMNKLFSIALLGASFFASAQISLAGKANVLIPTSSATWQNFKDAAGTAVAEKGKNITGFNVGLSLKADLPMSLYLMPEIYYSTFKNEATVTDAMGNETIIEAKTNRIDVPVLLGYRLLGNTLSAFAGPVGTFNLNEGETFRSFVEQVETKNFTVGYHFGLQSELKKLIISAKYEGAFSKDQRKFVTTIADADQEIEYDNRPSLFMLGLGYKF